MYLIQTGFVFCRMAPAASKEVIYEYPKGPLTVYRNKKSFDIRRMKVFVETEDLVEYKVSNCDVMEILNGVKYQYSVA